MMRYLLVRVDGELDAATDDELLEAIRALGDRFDVELDAGLIGGVLHDQMARPVVLSPHVSVFDRP